jgi:hypothetical protein
VPSPFHRHRRSLIELANPASGSFTTESAIRLRVNAEASGTNIAFDD